MLTLGITAAVLSMLLLSASDFLTKKPVQKLGGYVLSISILILAVIPIGLVFLFLPPVELTTFLFTLSILAGISLGGGYLLVFKSLETEQASNTSSMISPRHLHLLFAAEHSTKLTRLSSP